jgi:hypothetical protein
MMGYAYFEEGVLPEDDKYDLAPTETEVSGLPRGSFSLCRAHYFNDIWDEKIISHKLRVALVNNIAMQYINRGVAILDLIKEGNLGLTHALENFELEGGSRFSTYASRCIRQNIKRAILSQSGVNLSSCTSKIGPLPTIADSNIHRQRVSSRCAKTHRQCI